MNLQEIIKKWELKIGNLDSHIKSEVHTKRVSESMYVEKRTILGCLDDLKKMEQANEDKTSTESVEVCKRGFNKRRHWCLGCLFEDDCDFE